MAKPDDCVMKCANCGHYQAEAGQCWRYPPTVVVLDGEIYSAYPEIEPDERCGEFMRGDN